MKSKPSFAGLFTVLCLLLTGCDFEAPLTSAPTRKIDARLLGDWVALDHDTNKEEGMGVRSWDEATYAVSVDRDVYRVYHSDFAGQPFLSVQDLNSDARSYCLYTCSLSADSHQLTLRRVSTKVIPGTTRTSAGLQKLLMENLANPKLLEKEIQFTRKKR